MPLRTPFQTSPNSLSVLKIDIVSDLSCPWFAIVLSALEQALARLGEEVPIEQRFQPFKLNLRMPAEGEDTVEHLTRKHGYTLQQVECNGEALRQRGETVGFAFGKRQRIHNTFDAYRLLHWAGLEGRQRKLNHALVRGRVESARCCSTSRITTRLRTVEPTAILDNGIESSVPHWPGAVTWWSHRKR